MSNEIEKMQEFIKRNVRGCLPMIESAFVENNCACGNCAECKALLLASSDIAKNLYNEGYRKQSDTVKEFAEKVKSKLTDPSGWVTFKCLDLCYIIDELAKEYGVEVE